jgi:hypothetical protein
MKKINTYIYIGIALLAAVAFPGCELESEDYGSINTTLFPKTATDAEALVTDVYTMFLSDGWGTGIFKTANGLDFREYTSDIGETGNAHDWRAIVISAGWVNNTHQYVDDCAGNYWVFNKCIGSITLNIDRISAIDMDETRKKQLIAELHCARGLMAFLLYDFFGPIPLPTLEVLKNPLVEQIFPRATEAEMWKFIEDDLQAAIDTPELPDVYKKDDAEYGRFSRGIAYFALLKHYMQSRQWVKAEAAGRELQDPKYGYGLMNTYREVFMLDNEKGKETIFSNSFKKGYDAQEGRWFCDVLPGTYNTGFEDNFGKNKWNIFKLAWWFVHTFDADDPRGKEPILIREYLGTDGLVHNETNDKNDINADMRWGAIPLKYEFALATGGNTDIDYIIYRYADALTLLAEAIVRNANAVTQEAIDRLNDVRKRAMPNKPFTAASFGGSTERFLDSLLLERGHELYWEGCRRSDLVRHGKYAEKMKYKASMQGYTSGPTITENHGRFPLPQSAINEGKGIILQNPGY